MKTTIDYLSNEKQICYYCNKKKRCKEEFVACFERPKMKKKKYMYAKNV